MKMAKWQNGKMQKCKMQNAKCKMQNAKCKKCTLAKCKNPKKKFKKENAQGRIVLSLKNTELFNTNY